ncbi:hypothetical protein KNO15_12025 [Leifsonia shinshuensis]|uniref:hypothetical protein n=1 Tax=Leifsonia shinshuensis TaxID=150026 RepID=UPI001F514DFF|nr:hypothetical protein [Leifsonia shinshuensis]MCI0157420.1 hypothetical protein [Leifsonia shinshuensis]
MATLADPDRSELTALWAGALGGDRAPLERRLAGASRLPGPRANLELAARFADLVGATADDGRGAAVELLGGWLAGPPSDPGLPEGGEEFLAACAALAAGSVAAGSAADAADRLLTAAAVDDRWRVREMAATGMQRVLRADWSAGLRAVRAWLRSGEPLEVRAAVAAVAEPPLLKEAGHAEEAVEVVEAAVDLLLATPSGRRADDDVRVLRKALGYAVSVVAVAHPDAGLPLLERLATSTDSDARWIARQNLTKARLAPFADRLAGAREAAAQPR